MAQLALAWCLREGRVTTVLAGASRVSQLKENIAAVGNLRFTQDELDAIDAILAR